MIRSASFNPAPVARKTRNEALIAASLYLSLEYTIASNLDGVGRQSQTADGERLTMYSWSSLYSLALREMRSALRIRGWTPGSGDPGEDSDWAAADDMVIEICRGREDEEAAGGRLTAASSGG